MSIQNNVLRMSRLDKKLRQRKLNTVAFGRCLPKSNRVSKFNEELFDDIYEINCPPDLQSLKIVFNLILHLKSTRELVECLKQNPEMPRAKFLIDNNMFEATHQTVKAEKPLWSYYQ